MKPVSRFFITVLLLFIFGSSCFSQQFMIPFRNKNLWGYADLDGKPRVPARYDSVSYHETNFRWIVYKNGKSGVINEKGEEVLAPVYDTISYEPVHSRYHDFYASIDGKEGFADINGNWILEPFYEVITKCDSRFPNKRYFFFARQQGRWLLIDSSKKVYLDNIERFRNQYDGDYFLRINGKWGLYNVNSLKTLVPFEFDSIGRLQFRDFYNLKPGYEDYRWYAIKDKKITLIGKKSEILKTEYETLEPFYEQSKTDRDGYTMVESRVSPGNTYLTDLDSIPLKNNANPPSLALSYFFDDLRDVRKIKNDKKYGLELYYRTNTNSVPATFDEIKLISYSESRFNFRYIPVKNKNNWGLFDTDKKELVIPTEYSQLQLSSKYTLLIFSSKKNSIAFDFENNYNDVVPAPIRPFNNNAIQMKMVSSLRKEAEQTQFLKIYIMNIDGKLCPVGSNGIHYYKN